MKTTHEEYTFSKSEIRILKELANGERPLRRWGKLSRLNRSFYRIISESFSIKASYWVANRKTSSGKSWRKTGWNRFDRRDQERKQHGQDHISSHKGTRSFCERVSQQTSWKRANKSWQVKSPLQVCLKLLKHTASCSALFVSQKGRCRDKIPITGIESNIRHTQKPNFQT